MRTVLLGLAILALAGPCAAADPEHANIYHSMFGQRIVGNEVYVSVSNVWNEMDALPLAQKHCGTFGKVARFSHMETSRAVFDCIAAPGAIGPSPAAADSSPSAAPEGGNREQAIRFAFGLGCAVQDRDTARANAWASAAMGVVAALSEKSKDAASDFAGAFYSTDAGARAKGGYNCEGFPKWPG